MASRHEWVPNLLSRTTYSNFEYRLEEIKCQVDPYTKMDPNIDEHIAFAGGCKDPKILKQDGEFDEEDDETVHHG